MAKKDAKKPARRLKKAETVREKSKKTPKTNVRRVTKAKSAISKPVAKTSSFLKREYHLPLPDNKVGRFLGRRAYLTPKFLREATKEVKLVDWPKAKETFSLSMAVFIFAIFFGLIISAVDFGLERLFKELIIK